MANGFSSFVQTDIPPMEDTPLLASAFPSAAPSRAVPNRADAMFVVDILNMISLTHNSTTPGATFVLLKWSDKCGFWIQTPPQTCPQFGEIIWKVMAQTPIYIYSPQGPLAGGGALVIVGGVTIQGNTPVASAG